MNVLKIFVAVQFLFLSFQAFSNKTSDSLVSELKNSSDFQKFIIYEELYEQSLQSNVDSAFIVIEAALELAEHTSNNLKRLHFLNLKGKVYAHIGDMENAVEIYERTLTLAEQTGDSTNSVYALNNLGVIYLDQGEFNKASEFLYRALKESEKYGLLLLESSSLNNLGKLFFLQENWSKSIDYYQRSIKIKYELNDLKGIALLQNNIGIIYYYQGVLDSVLVCFERSLKIYEELDDIKGQTRPLFNIGEIYSEMGELDKALNYYEKSLAIERKIGYKKGYATSLVYIGEIYSEQGNFSKAIDYQLEGVQILKSINSKNDLADAYMALYQTYAETEDFENALFYYDKMVNLKDSIFTVEKSTQIRRLEAEYESEKREQQITNQQTQLAYRKKQMISLVMILLLSIALTVFVFYNNRKRKRSNELLSDKNKLLSLRNKQITHSITYASFIQKAILPNKELFDQLFTSSFIFYKPKDIVSGDFYWVNKKDDKIILAVADCTGHGVPGAIMSIMGITFLQEITDNYGITDPDEILNTLRDKITERLAPKNSTFFAREGIELAICCIDTEKKQFEYSAAYTPAILISEGEKKELKPNKMPIGIHRTRKDPFTKQLVSYKDGDVLYLFTDGYPDQFGGPEGKKYGTSRFKDVLYANHNYSMDDQFYMLMNNLKDWQGKKEQIDDITVIGIKL